MLAMQMLLLLLNIMPETRLETPQTVVQDVRQNVHLKKPLNPQTNRHRIRPQRQALSRITAKQVSRLKVLLHVQFRRLSTD